MPRVLETPSENRYFEGMSAREIDRLRADVVANRAPAELKARFDAANRAMNAAPDYAVRLYVEAVRVKNNRGLGKGEVYVVGLMADAAGKVVGRASQLYTGIGDGDLIDFGGKGFLGGEIVKPSRYVAFGLSVWESDKAGRDNAAAVEAILKGHKVQEIGRDIATAAGANQSVASIVERGVGLVTDLVFAALKGNKDDQLFLYEGTVTKEQAFNLPTETVDRTYARVRYNVDRVTLD